jgi:hypothetical protein
MQTSAVNCGNSDIDKIDMHGETRKERKGKTGMMIKEIEI